MMIKNGIVFVVAIVALGVLCSLQAARADTCYSSTALNFTSEQGGLYVNGNRLRLKGTSWFGFETSVGAPHGLWSKSYSFFLDFLSSNGFNAIRLPFHLSLAINDATPTSIDYGSNSDLQGLTSLGVMDVIIKAAAQRGILIMLDLHSFTADSYSSDGLWYNSNYPEATVISGWTKILQRYSSQWNVFAADLKNEPFSATWGTGADTDWNKGSARIANAIASSVSSRFLMFVEGTANSPSCSDACFYGEDLVGVASNPVALNYQWKLVYSPHVYGPNVYGQPYFSASNFPSNMAAIWDAHFGYIPASTGHAVVLGEWGGPYSGKDATWMEALASYLRTKDMTDQFFWCLNPDSGDTGGLLADDWTTPVSAKLTMLSTLVSSPTTFSVNSAGQVCVSGASSTITASPTPSSSPKSSSSSTPSATPTSSPKASATPSASPKASSSSTPAASVTPSSSPKTATSPSSSPKTATTATATPSSSPQATSSTSVTPTSSPKASSSATPSPAATGGATFTFWSGASTWWMAVTIPGSTSVKLDCGNGQGYVTLSPGWVDHMWTFTSTNGHACTSTLNFIVNGGAVQTISAPY